jgi:hypothetical protein
MRVKGKQYDIDSSEVRMFLYLASVGLWGKEIAEGMEKDSEGVDWDIVWQMAKEQTIEGLVASAFDYGVLGFTLEDIMPKDQRKALAKKIYSMEQYNLKMNSFIEEISKQLQAKDIHPVLLKGQGIAQTYLLPLRRKIGDVDLLFNGNDYDKARSLYRDKATKLIDDSVKDRHIALFIGKTILELHGSMHVFLTRKIDACLDELMSNLFSEKRFREWKNEGKIILLPDPQYDVIYVFCHILEHLFRSGVGLRQVCDLCRLLYSYSDEIDPKFVTSWIEKMGLKVEWKAFAALMVDYLGMNPAIIPMYDGSVRYSRKAARVMSFILSTGNMGRNRDESYKKRSYLVKKSISLWKIISDAERLGRIFPRTAAKTSFKWIKSGTADLKDGR